MSVEVPPEKSPPPHDGEDPYQAPNAELDSKVRAQPPEQPHNKTVAPPSRRWLLGEIPMAYVISVAATIGLYQAALVSSFFQQYLHTLVGAMFVAIPMLMLLPRRESFDSYGLPPKPLLREILFALTVAAIVFPPFWVGFRVWWGWERTFDFVVPDGFWNAALANLVVVALPEELFYRGYLMGRVDHVTKGRIKILGMKIGWSLIIVSALFAVGHYVVTWDPQRLAVFFPALLFGLMRIYRRSIAAAVVFHAMCNIFMDLMLLGYGVMRPQEYFQ